MTWIDDIERRANAATEGPWVVDGDNPTIVMKPDKPPSTWDGLLVARTRGGTGTDIDSLPEYADAEFIAHAREDVPALLAVLRERDNTIARVRALHVRNQEGSWTCGDWECEKCTEGDGHHGPVCDYCSFSTDDETVPSVVFWPCLTVQILDGVPAPIGLRAALDPQETP
jgi:hypothetical protein